MDGLEKSYRKAAALGLRKWRRMAGLTQEELAGYCGVRRATVIRWEDTTLPDSPSAVQLRRLINATGAIASVLVACLITDERILDD